SGDKVALGDSVTVEIEDVAILRRTVYARRIAALDDIYEARPQRGRRLSREGIRARSDAGRLAEGRSKAGKREVRGTKDGSRRKSAPSATSRGTARKS